MSTRVWTVSRGEDFEGGNTIAAFSSEDLAVEFASAKAAEEDMKRQDDHYYWHDAGCTSLLIEVFELDEGAVKKT